MGTNQKRGISNTNFFSRAWFCKYISNPSKDGIDVGTGLARWMDIYSDFEKFCIHWKLWPLHHHSSSFHLKNVLLQMLMVMIMMTICDIRRYGMWISAINKAGLVKNLDLSSPSSRWPRPPSSLSEYQQVTVETDMGRTFTTGRNAGISIEQVHISTRYTDDQMMNENG